MPNKNIDSHLAIALIAIFVLLPIITNTPLYIGIWIRFDYSELYFPKWCIIFIYINIIIIRLIIIIQRTPAI